MLCKYIVREDQQQEQQNVLSKLVIVTSKEIKVCILNFLAGSYILITQSTAKLFTSPNQGRGEKSPLPVPLLKIGAGYC